MNSLFQERFTIKVDTSACTSLLADSDPVTNDTWYYKDLTFESGKIYGLVSEYQQGCQYLSYLLGGRLPFEDVKMSCNGVPITQNDLKQVSINLEPNRDDYANQVVRKSIDKYLSLNREQEDFLSIAEKFCFTPEKCDRKFCHLSGMRWKTASAYGYAQRKRIFCAPYKPSSFYYQMCQTGLLKALRELADDGAIILLPVGSDEVMKHIADELVYLNRQYDIDELHRFYSEQFGKDWIH